MSRVRSNRFKLTVEPNGGALPKDAGRFARETHDSPCVGFEGPLNHVETSNFDDDVHSQSRNGTSDQREQRHWCDRDELCSRN